MTSRTELAALERDLWALRSEQAICTQCTNTDALESLFLFFGLTSVSQGRGGLGVADLTCRTGGFSVQEPRAAPAGQEAKQKIFKIIVKTDIYEICYHLV